MLYLLNFKYAVRNLEKAAAALLTVIMIGGVVAEIGIAGLFTVYFLTQSGFGVKLSAEALAAAQSGVDDAAIKIVRNKNLDYVSSASPYTIAIGSRSAQVTVCKDTITISSSCDTPNVGQDEVTSLGIAFTKRRELRAILSVDSATGQVKTISLQEIAL